MINPEDLLSSDTGLGGRFLVIGTVVMLLGRLASGSLHRRVAAHGPAPGASSAPVVVMAAPLAPMVVSSAAPPGACVMVQAYTTGGGQYHAETCVPLVALPPNVAQAVQRQAVPAEAVSR